MQRRQLLQVSTAAIGAISLAGCTINSGGESDDSENSESSEAESDESPEENTESSESSDTADSSESSDESDSDTSDSDDELVPESVEAVDEADSVERPENGVETQESTFSIDGDGEYGYHVEPITADEPAIIRWSITNERSPEHDFDVFFFTNPQIGTFGDVTQDGENKPIRYSPEGTVLGLEESAERTVKIEPGEYFIVIDATEFGEVGANREDKTIELTMKFEGWDA